MLANSSAIQVPLHESLIGIIGSTKYAGAVRYPETFGINSYLYCLGMRDKLRDAGVAIYEKNRGT